MNFQPLIYGRGVSGQAIERSLSVIESLPDSKWSFGKVRYAERGLKVKDLIRGVSDPLIFIANPHALHADLIKQCDDEKLPLVFCEKPTVTSASDRELLSTVKLKVAVLHGYRMMWGPQTLRRLVDDQSFGKIFGIECRYWQSSVATQAYEAAASGAKAPRPIWKNSAELSGGADVLIDLATHWMDLVVFLAGAFPKTSRGFRSYVNAESPHRDSHVQLTLDFGDDCYGSGSISKTVHGAGNDLEISILGSKISAHWSFQNPDQIVVGQNRDKTTLSRTSSQLGSRQPCFHGLGWLEGYVEVIHQGLQGLNDPSHNRFPDLPTSLSNFDLLQNTIWT